MECNVGPRERVARFGLAGLTALAALIVPGKWLRRVLGFATLAEATMAYTKYCPINAILGINNCGTAPQQDIEASAPIYAGAS